MDLERFAGLIRQDNLSRESYNWAKSYLEKNDFSDEEDNEKAIWSGLVAKLGPGDTDDTAVTTLDTANALKKKILHQIKEWVGDQAQTQLAGQRLDSESQDTEPINDDEDDLIAADTDSFNCDQMFGAAFYMEYIQLLGRNNYLRGPQFAKLVMFLRDKCGEMNGSKDCVLTSSRIQYLVLAIELYGKNYLNNVANIVAFVNFLNGSIIDEQNEKFPDLEIWYDDNIPVILGLLPSANKSKLEDMLKRLHKKYFDTKTRTSTHLQIADFLLGTSSKAAIALDNDRLREQVAETESHVSRATAATVASQVASQRSTILRTQPPASNSFVDKRSTVKPLPPPRPPTVDFNLNAPSSNMDFEQEDDRETVDGSEISTVPGEDQPSTAWSKMQNETKDTIETLKRKLLEMQNEKEDLERQVRSGTMGPPLAKRSKQQVLIPEEDDNDVLIEESVPTSAQEPEESDDGGLDLSNMEDGADAMDPDDILTPTTRQPVEPIENPITEFQAAKNWYGYLYRSSVCDSRNSQNRFLAELVKSQSLIDVLNNETYSCLLFKLHTLFKAKAKGPLSPTQENDLSAGNNPYQIEVQEQAQTKYNIDYFLAKHMKPTLGVTEHDDFFENVKLACGKVNADFWKLKWQNLVTLNASEIMIQNYKEKHIKLIDSTTGQFLELGLMCPMTVYMFLHSEKAGNARHEIDLFDRGGRLKDLTFNSNTNAEEGMLTDYIFWMLLLVDQYLSQIQPLLREFNKSKKDLNRLTSHFCSSFCMLAMHALKIPDQNISYIKSIASTPLDHLRVDDDLHESTAAWNNTNNTSMNNTQAMMIELVSDLFGHSTGADIAAHGLVKSFVLAVKTARQAVIAIDYNFKIRKLSFENLCFTWIASLLSPKSIENISRSIPVAYQHNTFGIVATPTDFVAACLGAHKYLQKSQAFPHVMNSIAGEARLVSLYPSKLVDIMAQSLVLHNMLQDRDSKSQTTMFDNVLTRRSNHTEKLKILNEAIRTLAQNLWIARYFPNQQKHTKNTTIHIFFDSRSNPPRLTYNDKASPLLRGRLVKLTEILNLFLKDLGLIYDRAQPLKTCLESCNQKLLETERENYNPAKKIFDLGRSKGPPKRIVYQSIPPCGPEWIRQLVLENNKHINLPEATFPLLGAIVDMRGVFSQKYNIHKSVIGSCLRPIWEWDIGHLVYASDDGPVYEPELFADSTKGKNFVCAYQGNQGREVRANSAVWFEGISNAGKTTQFTAAMMLQCAFQECKPSVTIIPNMKIDAPLKRALVESGIMYVSFIPEMALNQVKFEKQTLTRVGSIIFVDDATTKKINPSWGFLLDDAANFSLVPYIITHGDVSNGGAILRTKCGTHAKLGNITHDVTKFKSIPISNKNDIWYTTMKQVESYIKNEHAAVRYVSVCTIDDSAYAISEKPIFQTQQGTAVFMIRSKIMRQEEE